MMAEEEKKPEGAGENEEVSREASADEKDPSAQIAELEQQLLYQRADFENFRKRMQRDQEQALKFANERIVKELLPVVDQLERAITFGQTLKTRKDDAEASNLLAGVELTHRELNQLFARFGVEFVGTPGEKFDPSRHEAISQKETAAESVDTVLEVFQKGCLIYGRLISPAKVVVGIKKNT